jgi:hypothetical protein
MHLCILSVVLEATYLDPDLILITFFSPKKLASQHWDLFFSGFFVLEV